MAEKVVHVRYDGHFAVLYMHPALFNLSFVSEMHQALDEIEQRKDVRVLITTSTGKFYCNSLDVKWYEKQPIRVLEQFWPLLDQMLARILTFPMPTVAAINGHAAAGGAVLALAHDYRVMREDRGCFIFTEVFVNVRIKPGWLRTIEYKITNAKFLRDAVFFGKKYLAKDAINSDLVDASAPQEQLLQSAKDLINVKHGDVSQFKDRKMLNIMKRDFYRDAYKLLHDKSLWEIKPNL